MPTMTPLQGAHACRGQTGSFGKLLLRQPSLLSQPLQLSAEV